MEPLVDFFRAVRRQSLSPAQLTGEVFGKTSENHIGAGALDRQHQLRRDPALVES